MSKYKNLPELFTAIANSIKAKKGNNNKIPAENFPEEIDNISTGADVSGVTATAPDVLSEKVIVDKDGNPLAGSMPNNGAGGGTISAKADSIAIPEGYYSGSGKVTIASTEQSKIIAGNIKSGVTLLGIKGSYTGTYKYVSGSASPNSSNLEASLTITNSAFKTSTTLVAWYIYASSYGRKGYLYFAGGTGLTGKGYDQDNGSSASTPAAGTPGYMEIIDVTRKSGSLVFSCRSASGSAFNMFDYNSTYQYFIVYS